MFWTTRPDARPAEGVPPYRRFMPALMPTRRASSVLLDQRVALDRTRAFLDEFNVARGAHATVFHVVIWAIVRTLAAHPRLNRFVAGGRLWQRDGIWISYTAKKAFDEDAPLFEVKRRFEPDVSFADVVKLLHGDVAAGRDPGHVDATDRQLRVLLALPHSVRRAAVLAVNRLDALGLLPRSWIEPDPFFASVFVTNLGSVGLDAVFHHLYDYGNIPLFCAVGRVHDDGGHPVVSLKFTYDERVDDGFYAARALEDLRAMVEDPAAHTPFSA